MAAGEPEPSSVHQPPPEGSPRHALPPAARAAWESEGGGWRDGLGPLSRRAAIAYGDAARLIAHGADARDALGTWIGSIVRRGHAVTLTLARAHDGREPPWALVHAWRRHLSRRALGESRYSRGERLPVAVCWERHRSGAWHAHALVGTPPHLPYNATRQEWRAGHAWVRAIDGAEAAGYATKAQYAAKAQAETGVLTWDLLVNGSALELTQLDIPGVRSGGSAAADHADSAGRPGA